MINNTSLIVLTVCLSSFFISQGQENSTWYAYSVYGDKQKITELKEAILYEEVKEEDSPYPARIDTVRIEKRLNDSIYIITHQRRDGEFALMANAGIRDRAIKSIGIYYPSETVEAVETLYNREGLPVWNRLTTRWVFSEGQTKVLERAPGYDEVSREAIIDALSVREAISPLLKTYVEEHPDTKPSRLYRFVEIKGQQKFIELGYNPYKQVEYNFEKQFEGDEEVIRLLTTPVSFE